MRPFQSTPGDEQDRLRHNFFYRDGTPETARALLRKFLCDDRPQLDADLEAEDPERREVAAAQLFQRTLFFVRAAKRRPELVRVYESVLLGLDRAERRHLFPILMQVGDEATWALLREQAQKHGVDASNAYYGPDPRFERIARAPITHPAHLDLRWVEFMATGDTRPVVEILACLAGPDRIREHLEPRLRPVGGLAALFTAQRGRQKQLIEGMQQLGIRLHGKTHAILNADDLDTFVVDGSERGGARLKVLFDALPEPPPAELTRDVMVKTSAKWSLALNAAEHAPVLAVCEEGAARLGGNGRLNLLAVLAEAHERRGDFPAAQQALRRWIELNPGRADELRERVDRLELERAFAAIAGAGEAERKDMSQEEAVAAARRCAEVLAGTPSYHARAEFTLRAPPRTDGEVIRSAWTGRFAAGGRAHVFRAFWTRTQSGLADEWCDIAGERYVRGPGVWIRPPRSFPRVGESDALAVGVFARLLAGHAPDRGAVLAGPATRFVELSHDRFDPGDHLTRVGAPPGPARVVLRIHQATGWLAEAAVESLEQGDDVGFTIVYRFVRAEPPLVIEVGDVIDASAAPVKQP